MTQNNKINILDASWLALDTEETPMHVGNLQILSLPKDAPANFLRDDVHRMKSAGDIVSPWNKKLAKPSLLGRLLAPSWVIDKNIDLDYHVRHSALPKPGGERELGILVSRLHSNRMDFKRPLWECHVIEGLENNRFAIYTKMHHSLIDGISGVRLLQRTLSESPDDIDTRPPWSIGTPKKIKSGEHIATWQGALDQAIDAIKEQASNTPQLVGALAKLVSSSVQDRVKLSAPFTGPNSTINTRVQAARRFATQQYSLDRIKKLAAEADASLNDIVLYLCGTSLRQFLLEKGQLPEQPLTAGIPVNIRPADDTGTGTAISFMIASLATNEADPLRRLATIKESTQIAKEHLQSLPRASLTQYTMLMMAPYSLQLLTGLGGRMRPAFNITISNVPGPKKALYYNGCKLEAMYPVSLIAHGGALNITCLSYDGSLNFGYTGCRDTLPSMQNLAVFSGEALEELEGLLTKKAKTRKTKTKKATTR
ncbi:MULTISPECIES: wax ester/triacylglycerol synthase family O-acyltransferase [unclassified Oleiphilus]|jgi:WS/DGAT/MGAT family acyltransferase|nr:MULTISPECIES: wax ester/triacylglycerol synthase family O-acyltransferase [unclassified Oleiphilus]KZY78706.1 diacylglycerol O-acyltransferase [Oleiphilus sp. HI0068]KZY80207.1 diacylglycerol O-acyltransferase [Oleiphilus sp. HI0069]KZZ16780.1 diacylglycerol O-acyltransferase [Oleiphilus sp. HI0078]KZZ53579.1 diacylglycerol O-acyltransferase [Oleiphilus sp. HI0123]KZY32245.1 diacylglycerol O-acyltransferase [Oleiphilus sp. HI0043]